MGSILLSSGEFGSGPASRGKERKSQCLLLFLACLPVFSQGTMQKSALPFLHPISPWALLALFITGRLLPSQLELGERSSQSGSQAAEVSFISLSKYLWALLGTSTSLLFSLCNDLKLQLCKQQSVKHNAMRGGPE